MGQKQKQKKEKEKEKENELISNRFNTLTIKANLEVSGDACEDAIALIERLENWNDELFDGNVELERLLDKAECLYEKERELTSKLNEKLKKLQAKKK